MTNYPYGAVGDPAMVRFQYITASDLRDGRIDMSEGWNNG